MSNTPLRPPPAQPLLETVRRQYGKLLPSAILEARICPCQQPKPLFPLPVRSVMRWVWDGTVAIAPRGLRAVSPGADGSGMRCGVLQEEEEEGCLRLRLP